MKTCSDCKKNLSLECFNKKKSNPDGRQSKCRDCSKAWYKTYYSSSDKERSRLYVRNKAVREIVREEVRKRKAVPCADCKKRYPYYVMDFDHQYDKSFNIGTAVSSNIGLEPILKEIEKCEVVCANCHRIRTHGYLDVDDLI